MTFNPRLAAPALAALALSFGCSSGALVVGSDRPGAPHCGGTLVADLGGERITRVTADESHAYLVTYRDVGPQGGQAKQGAGSTRILRVELDGSGNVTALATETSAGAIVADDDNVYFARTDDTHGEIASMRKDGSGAAVVLATDQAWPSSIAVDATHVYWTNRGNAATGGQAMPGGGVYRVPKRGGAVQQISPESLEPWDIVVDDTSVYWNDAYAAQSGLVMAAPKDGSSGARQLAAGQMNLAGLSVDASNVYWATGGGGQIVGIAKTGGAPRPLASPGLTVGVAADGASVYFTSSNALMRVDPKSGAVQDLQCSAGLGTFALISTSVVVGIDDKLWVVPK